MISWTKYWPVSWCVTARLTSVMWPYAVWWLAVDSLLFVHSNHWIIVTHLIPVSNSYWVNPPQSCKCLLMLRTVKMGKKGVREWNKKSRDLKNEVRIKTWKGETGRKRRNIFWILFDQKKKNFMKLLYHIYVLWEGGLIWWFIYCNPSSDPSDDLYNDYRNRWNTGS